MLKIISANNVTEDDRQFIASANSEQIVDLFARMVTSPSVRGEAQSFAALPDWGQFSVAVVRLKQAAAGTGAKWTVSAIEHTSTLMVRGELGADIMAVRPNGDEFWALLRDFILPTGYETVVFKDSAEQMGAYGAHHFHLERTTASYFGLVVTNPGAYWGWIKSTGQDRAADGSTDYASRLNDGSRLEAPRRGSAGSVMTHTVSSDGPLYILNNTVPKCEPPARLVCCDYRTGPVAEVAGRGGTFDVNLMPEEVCVKYYCE